MIKRSTPASCAMSAVVFLVLLRNVLGGSPHTEIEVVPLDEL
ncbi:hypothetical protein WME79_28970 [Sorangium sp. So ce726]